jgi:hypothetical protein
MPAFFIASSGMVSGTRFSATSVFACEAAPSATAFARVSIWP